MDKFFVALFLGIFVYNAILNPFWALWAYPVLGIIIWCGARMLGRKLPFIKVIFCWFPMLAAGLFNQTP